jgi:multidrug transporter EmrE-like cation transporter
MPWILLFIAIILEVTATTALKLSESFTKLPETALSLTLYVLSIYLLSLTLKTIAVGIAYAVWAGVGIALITIIGHFAFRQILDVPAFIGIALIISGVLVLNLVSKTSLH